MRYSLLVALVVACICTTLRADVLTLLPVADSFVDALNPDTAFPTGHLEAAMTGENAMPATELTFLYAQYQLPDGLTGQDFASINSVNFSVRRASETTAKLNMTYYVYGVFDGIDTESADTYTWNDSVGFDETHNEVRFLTPDEISYYSDPGESAFIGTLDTTSSGPTTRPFSVLPDHFQSATALQNRSDMILQDTDGLITVYMRVRAPFEVTPLQMFASLENPDMIEAPVLTIDFVPGGGAVDGDYNGNGTVDAADYVVWRKHEGLTGGATVSEGDGTGDGNVTSEDYDYWVARFGNTSGAGSLGSAAATPEPSALFLVMAGMLAPVATFRRLRPHLHPRRKQVRQRT